ncbi:MAG: prolipoprotein diacylglyceryl transferase [Bacillota bacterium]
MHWTGEVKSIAFTIFGRDVAWYGIIVTFSMIVGLLGAIRLSKKIKLSSDDILEMFLFVIPFAIVFARLGFVFTSASDFFVSDFGFDDFINIFAIWDGGLTIMTGVPGGVLGAYVWCRWRKVDILRLVDAIICIVLLSQAIGRWGNFFNQEIYGMQITNESLQFFPVAVYIAKQGAFHQATFFYESVLNVIGFFAMYFVSRRLLVKGHSLPLYVFVYGMIRFIMEFFRYNTNVYYEFNAVRIISLVAALIGGGFFAFMVIKEKKKGKRIWYKDKIPPKLIKPAKYGIKKEGKTE